MSCLFCDIAAGRAGAHIVFSDERCVAFLDRAPLFPGHLLLVPREHVATFMTMPPQVLPSYFAAAQRLSIAAQITMPSEGIFVAINNVVSQSVPHLHTHIVPRTKGDGLKGFFWPRKKYKDEAEMATIAARIRAAL